MKDDPDPVTRLIRYIKKLFRTAPARQESKITALRDMLAKNLRDNQLSAEVGYDEYLMLYNILNLNTLQASDVMVPRGNIIALSSESSMETVKKHFMECTLTRLPVYNKKIDDVIGFLHLKDVIKIWDKPSITIKNHLHPALMISPRMRIGDLLVKMRSKRTHLAIVLDDYGCTQGMVTIEDVLETIIGDIDDEHDVPDVPDIKEIRPNVFEASARLDIEELETALGRSFDGPAHEECDTVGGLVFVTAKRIPAKGEKIVHPSGIIIQVLDADLRRIRRVRIYNKPIANKQKSSQ